MNQDQPTNGFKVTVVGDGVSVERTVDAEKAGAVMALLLSARSPRQPLEAGAPFSAAPGSRSDEGRPRLALRECLQESGASRFPQKIVVIGDYLMEHEGQDDFGREDVRSAFQKAREVPPRNLPRDFGSAVQNGWIAELANKPGRFYVTNSGNEAIARKFVQDGPRQSVRRRRQSGRQRGLSNLSPDASE